MYEKITSEFGEEIIKRENSDGSTSWIPTDPANSDYAEYLRYTEWVEEGNDPEDFWVQEQQADALEDSEPKEEE